MQTENRFCKNGCGNLSKPSNSQKCCQICSITKNHTDDCKKRNVIKEKAIMLDIYKLDDSGEFVKNQGHITIVKINHPNPEFVLNKVIQSFEVYFGKQNVWSLKFVKLWGHSILTNAFTDNFDLDNVRELVYQYIVAKFGKNVINMDRYPKNYPYPSIWNKSAPDGMSPQHIGGIGNNDAELLGKTWTVKFCLN